MKHFIAEGRPQYKLNQLIDMGITWTEYRVWRTIYEILAEGQDCYWKTDSKGAEKCRMNRPQYINAIKGLVEKGIIHSLGEGQYVVMFENDNAVEQRKSNVCEPLCARGKIDVQEVLRENYNVHNSKQDYGDDDDFPF